MDHSDSKHKSLSVPEIVVDYPGEASPVNLKEALPADLSHKKHDDVEEPVVTSRSISETIRDNFKACVENLIMISFTGNSACRKMFKSHQSIIAERERQKALPFWDRYVIHPYSICRMFWDVLMVLLFLLLAVSTPITWSFDSIRKMESGGLWSTINHVGDLLLVMDILVNFRSGYIEDIIKTSVVLDSCVVAKRYLKTFFVLDVVCTLPGSLPMDLLMDSVGDVKQYTPYFVFLRVIRLARLYRYRFKVGNLISLRATIRRFIVVVVVLILLQHWNACLQYLVANVAGFKDSWVAQEGLVNEEALVIYFRGLFRTISHMLGIGYGQYTPGTLTDIASVMVSVWIGNICYALFIANLNHLVMLSDTSSNKYDEKVEETLEFMKLHRLPKQFRNKVEEYFAIKYNLKYFDTHELLGNINPNIKREIMHLICRDLVCKSALFANAPREFILEVCENMDFDIFLPGDVIVREGENGSNLYFIETGKVACIKSDGTLLATLQDGSLFGEISVLEQTACTCNVVSMGYTYIYYLSCKAFKQIISEYPNVKDRIRNATNRQQNNKILSASSIAPVTRSMLEAIEKDASL